MDYIRGLEEAHFPLPSEILDHPAALLQQIHHHHHLHQQNLDLNLHLSPPPPPPPLDHHTSSPLGLLRPLGSGDIFDMSHNPYLWGGGHHHRHHGSTLSSTPPSPGELDFTIFQQQQSSPWGLDFTEDGTENLDLDLSPLLQEHILHHQQADVDDVDPQPLLQSLQSLQNLPSWMTAGPRSARSRAEMHPRQAEEDRPAQEHPPTAVPSGKSTDPPSCSTSKQEQPGTGPKTSDSEEKPKHTESTTTTGTVTPTTNSGSGAFFDCNVCLDAASEPVVTTCGHLFCWPCLYQWLHLHSHCAECPVCKGAVTDDDIVPIYGRGGGGKASAVDEQPRSVGTNIPPRPRARRAESVRQQALQHRSSSNNNNNNNGEGAMLHEMLRWRRAVRFMQENVDRLFHARNSSRRSPQAAPHINHQRRRMERRDGFRMGSRSEELLLASAHGGSNHHHNHNVASIQARISSVEGMIEQLQQPWQPPPPILPPQAYIDLASPPPMSAATAAAAGSGSDGAYTPHHDPYTTYQILHGLRRMPV